MGGEEGILRIVEGSPERSPLSPRLMLAERLADTKLRSPFSAAGRSPSLSGGQWMSPEKSTGLLTLSPLFRPLLRPPFAPPSPRQHSPAEPPQRPRPAALRKRQRKDERQLDILRAAMPADLQQLSKERLAELSAATGLDQYQVYKWFWDQKFKARRRRDDSPQKKVKVDSAPRQSKEGS